MLHSKDTLISARHRPAHFFLLGVSCLLQIGSLILGHSVTDDLHAPKRLRFVAHLLLKLISSCQDLSCETEQHKPGCSAWRVGGVLMPNCLLCYYKNISSYETGARSQGTSSCVVRHHKREGSRDLSTLTFCRDKNRWPEHCQLAVLWGCFYTLVKEFELINSKETCGKNMIHKT